MADWTLDALDSSGVVARPSVAHRAALQWVCSQVQILTRERVCKILSPTPETASRFFFFYAKIASLSLAMTVHIPVPCPLFPVP